MTSSKLGTERKEEMPKWRRAWAPMVDSEPRDWPEWLQQRRLENEQETQVLASPRDLKVF
jgi:hypothetical protein